MIKEGGRLQTVELVIRIADYVFRDKEKVRKGFGEDVYKRQDQNDSHRDKAVKNRL